ncbi:MAG TPA: hypothetical protein VL359_12745, partial [bacterium]|nr:hypothetical protein [bacterium]
MPPITLFRHAVSRRHNQIVLTLTILLDLGIVIGAWNLAYWLRFDAINLPPAQFLTLDAQALSTLQPQGLSPQAIQAVLAANNPPATSDLDLSGAVTRALAPFHLQSLTPRVVSLARGERSVPAFGVYARVSTFLLVISVVLFYAMGVYRTRRFRSWRSELDSVVKAAAAVVAVTVGASFFYRHYSYSRVHMAYFAVCLLVGLVCNRVAIRWVVRELRRHGKLVRRSVLAGDSALAAAFY